MWFIGVEVEQETSTPPPKKNPGSAPALCQVHPSCQNIHAYSSRNHTNLLVSDMGHQKNLKL